MRSNAVGIGKNKDKDMNEDDGDHDVVHSLRLGAQRIIAHNKWRSKPFMEESVSCFKGMKMGNSYSD
jgi:hypothetical protein